MPLKSFSPFNDIVISWAGVLASQASVTYYVQNGRVLKNTLSMYFYILLNNITINVIFGQK